MLFGADSDAVSNKTADDLTPAIKTVPDIDAFALFISCIPL